MPVIDVTFWLCGAVVSVRCSEPYDEIVRAYLAPAVISNPDDLIPEALARLTPIGAEIVRGPPVQQRPELEPFLQIEWILKRWAMALKPSVSLHSGCVIFRERPLLFVAPSGSGKSSMSLAAVREHGEYVTDDFLVLSEGHGFGFARAIRFKSIPADDTVRPTIFREWISRPTV